MNTFVQRFTTGLAGRVLGAIALAGFFAGGALVATATAPQFNSLPDDLPTLMVAKPGDQWTTNTTAQVGDTVNLLVWDHNDIPDTTAHNTTIKVNLPSGFSLAHNVSATVSADNAAAVTGTSTLTSTTATAVSFVPNSVTYYKNVFNNETNQYELTKVNAPAGVDGNTITTTGINLGDQNGCWAYAQAVMLQVKIEGGNPHINTNKKVDLYGGQATYGDSVTAQPNDLVDFKVFVENDGTATAHSAQVVDTLDSHFTYVPGSSLLRQKINNQDVDTHIPDSQVSFDGQKITWSFGDIAPNPESSFYLQFQVRLAQKDNFPIGQTNLQNCAIARTVEISANTNCVSVIVNRSQDNIPGFSLRKEVTNLTLGDSQWYNVQLASAKPGDLVGYRLILVNTGNTPANNVTLKDILPAGIAFDGDVKLYNKANPNGIVINNDSLVKNGYVFSTLVNGNDNYQTITFRAKITTDCNGTKNLDNWGRVYYNGQDVAHDDAGLIISCSRSLIISKDARVSGFYSDHTEAHEGDVITYRINVQNNGNTVVNNPTLHDVLPQYTAYLPGTLAIDGDFQGQAVQNAFWSNGVILTNLNPGMGKVITFQVKITDCPPFGDTYITNTGYVKADGISEIHDDTLVIVHVRKPILP